MDAQALQLTGKVCLAGCKLHTALCKSTVASLQGTVRLVQCCEVPNCGGKGRVVDRQTHSRNATRPGAADLVPEIGQREVPHRSTTYCPSVPEAQLLQSEHRRSLSRVVTTGSRRDAGERCPLWCSAQSNNCTLTAQ